MELLNIKFSKIKKDEIITNYLPGTYFTPNVDIVIKLQENKLLYDYYKTADIVLCDSRILSRLARIFFNKKIEVIPGSSFFNEFYKFHKTNPKIKIFIFGGCHPTADMARNNINTYCGRDIVVDSYSPSNNFDVNSEENDLIVNLINKSKANVLLVGLGCPKQELWIQKYRNHLTYVETYLPLGATIDFEAKSIKRAPKYIQYLGVEWFYRIIQDPKRLVKRYLIDDMKIFKLLLLERLRLYKNPFSDA